VKPILLLLLLFPLIAALINAVAGKNLSRKAVGFIACGGVLGTLVLAVVAMILAGEKTYELIFFNWFRVDSFSADMNVYYDPLAAVMTVMVTFVSLIIHIYSVGFMRAEEGVRRYFIYLNLFVFFMLVISLADNLIFVFLGWEGVGFCSYSLIGFWYEDEDKVKAGAKAFIVTRLGDVTFGVAIALFFILFGNFSILHIIENTAVLSAGMATLLGLLLLWAAVGKSAQLPLVVWLPDAMAGPSPVSALIHAATMVTAGVYLLMRLFPVLALSSITLSIIATVGAVGTLYAACAAMAQTDIKRILAYSTISQVGYMFLAVGAGDIVGGMFHLLSHAFFKALLFMTAGLVIQALAEEHNIFRMGNLRKVMPGVFWLTFIGAVCLSAFPLVGGYFSKDRILLATFMQPGALYKILWTLAAVAAVLTPFYTFRLFLTAFGERPGTLPRSATVPLPRFMVWILAPLALVALFDGLLNLPFGPGKELLAHYMSVVPGSVPNLNAPADLAWSMSVGSAAAVLAALGVSYFLYRRPKEGTSGGFTRLLISGFYLDLFYHWLIARPYRRIADFLFVRVDEGVLDSGFIKIGEGVEGLSGVLRLWADGKISTYLKMVLAGFTAILTIAALYWGLW